MTAPQFYAWSHSRLNQYETCPFQAYAKHLLKLPEPGNDAMERGNVVHAGMESYLINPLATVPAFELRPRMDGPRALDKFAACASELKSLDPMVEQEWGFTDKWQATGWFGKDTWFRLKSDAVALVDNGAIVIDWKTGKPWGSGQDQMEQTAVGVFARYFDVQEVDTRLWYLDTGDEIAKTFTRAQFVGLRDKWAARAQVMLNDTTFTPRPGAHCRRCHFRASNNGPCKLG